MKTSEKTTPPNVRNTHRSVMRAVAGQHREMVAFPIPRYTLHDKSKEMFVAELCVLRTFGGVDFSLISICVQYVPEFLWDRLRASIQFHVMPGRRRCVQKPCMIPCRTPHIIAVHGRRRAQALPASSVRRSENLDQSIFLSILGYIYHIEICNIQICNEIHAPGYLPVPVWLYPRGVSPCCTVVGGRNS
eukprot:COSAG02_NODE_6650_length_3436_cov_3.932673_3_plen_189_part_00